MKNLFLIASQAFKDLINSPNAKADAASAWRRTEFAIQSDNMVGAIKIAIEKRQNKYYFDRLINAKRSIKLDLIEALSKIQSSEASKLVVRFFKSGHSYIQHDGEKALIRNDNYVRYLIHNSQNINAAERLMQMIERQTIPKAKAQMIKAGNGDVYQAFVEKGFQNRIHDAIKSLPPVGYAILANDTKVAALLGIKIPTPNQQTISAP